MEAFSQALKLDLDKTRDPCRVPAGRRGFWGLQRVDLKLKNQTGLS